MAEGREHKFSDSGSDSMYDFYCEFCNENGQHVEAAGHCTDCGEYLCGSCVGHHRGNRFTKNHEILDRENMPKDTPPSPDHVRKDITTMCKQHKSELVKYYCKSHDELACSKCTINSHKSCTDIVDIIETSSFIFDCDEFKDFIQKLSFLESQANDIARKSREQSDESIRFCSEAIESVRQFRDEINSVLDDIETSLKTEADAIKTKDVTKMKTIEDTCNTLQETIEKLSSEFQGLQSENRVCQTYIRMKETAVEVEKIKEKLAEAEESNSINEFTFIQNDKLVDFMKKLDSFGILSVKENIVKRNQDTALMSNTEDAASHESDESLSFDERQDEDNHTQNTAPKPKAISLASFIHEINVKSTRDTKICYISGSVVLSNRKLLVVDNKNGNVKLIDTQNINMIDELDVTGKPWDATVITGNYVAVTVPVQRTVIVLKVTDTIIKHREISVGGACHGIAYSKNQLIVSYCTPRKIEIMDLHGNVITTMEKDGNTEFDRPEYICISNDGGTIYVSDYKRLGGQVMCLDRNGDVKAIYTDTALDGPQMICIDHHGNLYVCGYHSNNIHVISPDCTKTKVLLTKTDGLTQGVSSASYCRQTERLFVGMWGYDEVKVYQLS